MKVREVHDMVRRGQVAKAPTYHPGKRGLSFLQILTALERCYRVARDDRADPQGGLLYPRGWYALANLPHRRRIRIDFDLVEDDAGKLILIVTAYDA